METNAQGSQSGKVGLLSHDHRVTQAAVLLPVIAMACAAVWVVLARPTNGKSDPTTFASSQTVGIATRPEAVEPTDTDVASQTARAEPDEPGSVPQPPATEAAAIKGLRISSQSWQRGGLGSNALITFTLRNDNAYAVKDIAIACAFSRQDGSHLTDRQRVIPDITVNKRSHRTFAQIHIGYVNVYANKAKCTPVSAART